MKYNEILDLSEVLGEGFFADRVVELLKARKKLNDKDKKLLSRILVFVEKARKGERQVKSGKLSSDAVDSIGAYQRVINSVTCQSIEKGSKKAAQKAFNTMLKNMELEVAEGMGKQTIEPKEFENTVKFFEFVRNQTLSEASKQYLTKVEVAKWPSLLY
jgi:hypothetical protein